MTELQVVLLPDQAIGDGSDVVVCDFGQLMEHLLDDQSLADAIENSAIDSGKPTPELFAKVRALNETGDAAAYWGHD